MRRLHMKTLAALLITVLALTALFSGAAFAADDSIVIRSLSVTFKSEYGEQEILEPTVTTTTAGLSVESIVWSRDIDKWKAGKNERVSVILKSDSKIFADKYNRTACKMTGANFVSAKSLDDNTLEVKADYVPVVILGDTAQAGWSDGTKTKAVWKRVEFATGYQLKLYADDKMKKTLTVKSNTVDLAEYMTQEASFYYEVRATGYTADDRKYMKPGEYVTSTDVVMEYEGDTEGEWKGNLYRQDDGSYSSACWKQILNDWYYFGENGERQKGWVKTGQRWYYLEPKEGKLLKGWQLIDTKWYYLNPGGGEMMTGWVETKPGTWFYLYADGTMAANTVIDGCYVDATGQWIP